MDFIPQNSIDFVNQNSIRRVSKIDISLELVGEKAFGLSCLPKLWTLPYIVISKDLVNMFRNTNHKKEFVECFNSNWVKYITQALEPLIDDKAPLIIRSSGCEEGLNERGKLHSTHTSINELNKDLLFFLETLEDDQELKSLSIPLIIQKFIPNEKDKGHLSNERRLYKDTRDWIGEMENSTLDDHVFKINLRKWREKIEVNKFQDKPLGCGCRLQIKNTLKIPATWAHEKHLRIHFEWVYDGDNMYIVQADEAKDIEGINPLEVYSNQDTVQSKNSSPSILEKVTIKHAEKFLKIHNVFIYKTLKLPIANLYILDSKEYIQKLKSSEPTIDLTNDLKNLFQSGFVIRMDVDTDNLKVRQMLPRGFVKTAEDAITWLQKESKKINLSDTNEHNFVYIFHGFIPAIASAFAYAAPNERKVQIEALWGLPEGLYYNSHDKYVVDTGVKDITKINTDKFELHKQIKYKGFCVVPNDNGEWNSERVKPPHDWHESIQREDWIYKIAHDSRLIAEKESKPISIMWFVNVEKSDFNTELFPWHHEDYDFQLLSKTNQKRKKTPFDQIFLIKNSKDVNRLIHENNNKNETIRFVKIQPSDSELLRNKETLYEIGKLTKELNATILLEGGILSHAFYQLMQTNASVEILLPFNDANERLSFNKLVRDKIPANIERGGESVQMVKLTKNSLLQALKDKLIEEAFEVSDASEEEVLSELSDVKEVFDQILSELGISNKELSDIQQKKRDKAGGFVQGVVLTETHNPIPEHKSNSTSNGQLFPLIELETTTPQVDYNLINNKQITRHEDRRKQGDSIETILRVDSPILRKGWDTKSKEITLSSYPKEKFILKISSLREGMNNRLELSISTEKNGQLSLDLFNADERT